MRIQVSILSIDFLAISALLLELHRPNLQFSYCEVSTLLVDKCIPSVLADSDPVDILCERSTLIFAVEWLFECHQFSTAEARALLA